MEMTLAMTIHKTFLHDCVQQCDCDGCHVFYWSIKVALAKIETTFGTKMSLAKKKESTGREGSVKTMRRLKKLRRSSPKPSFMTAHQCHCDSAMGAIGQRKHLIWSEHHFQSVQIGATNSVGNKRRGEWAATTTTITWQWYDHVTSFFNAMKFEHPQASSWRVHENDLPATSIRKTFKTACIDLWQLSGAAGPWRQYHTNLPHDCASMRCNSCQDENGTAHEMQSTRHSFKTAFIDVTSQQQWVETTGIIFLHLSSWIGNATTWKYTCLDPCMPSWPQEAEEAQQLSSLYCAWTCRQTVL